MDTNNFPINIKQAQTACRGSATTNNNTNDDDDDDDAIY